MPKQFPRKKSSAQSRQASVVSPIGDLMSVGLISRERETTNARASSRSADCGPLVFALLVTPTYSCAAAAQPSTRRKARSDFVGRRIYKDSRRIHKMRVAYCSLNQIKMAATTATPSIPAASQISMSSGLVLRLLRIEYRSPKIRPIQTKLIVTNNKNSGMLVWSNRQTDRNCQSAILTAPKNEF